MAKQNVARATLKHQPEWYTPAALMSGQISEKEIREEYSRLRDIAQKRLKRFEGTQWTRTKAYKENVNFYPVLKDMKDKGVRPDGRVTPELAYKLSALARFINAKGSTVSGQKSMMKKNLATLHKHHFDFVTEENYLSFAEFMAEWRAQGLATEYDSEWAVELYDQVERHSLDPAQVAKNFEYWLENRKAMAELEPSLGMSAGSARRLRDRIEKKKKREQKKEEKQQKKADKKSKKRKKGTRRK